MKVLIVRTAVLLCLLLQFGYAQDFGDGTQDPSLDSLLSMRITTASKHWESTSDAPASTTIVTSTDIKRFGYRTLEDVLKAVRGFYVSYDRNYSYIGVRGFSRPTDYNNRLLLLVNGHTLNEGFYGSAPFGTDFIIDFDAVDRIEIIRGPGSVLYGSGAMFAVVNVLTKPGVDLNSVQLLGETGSFGRARGSTTLGMEFSEDFDGMLSARWANIKGQDLFFSEYNADSTYNGIAHGLDWDRYVGFFSTINYRSLVMQAAFSTREKGIPTGSYGTAFGDPYEKTLDRYSFLEAKFDQEIDVSKGIMIRGYYDHYYYTGTYPYDKLSHEATTANRIGGEFQFRWDLSSSNRLSTGLEYINNTRSDFRNWDVDTTFYDGNFPFTTFSLYVQDEYQLTSDLAFTVGVRRDAHSIAGSSIMPRASAVYHPTTSGTVKLLYGEAYRAPNMNELNYEDNLSDFKVSRNLRREHITTIELELSQRLSDELHAVASLYTYTMKDLIDERIDPTDSLLQFQNFGKVQARGFDCELTARLHVGLNGYINYTYEHAANAANNAGLTNSPTHMLKLGLGYNLVDYLRAAFEMQYQTGRLTVQGFSTDPFFITNLNIATSSPANRESRERLLDWLRVTLLVRNLFNVKYATPGGFEHQQAGIIQNGREFLLKLELTL